MAIRYRIRDLLTKESTEIKGLKVEQKELVRDKERLKLDVNNAESCLRTTDCKFNNETENMLNKIISEPKIGGNH